MGISYKRHRFPAEIISHCVWLYYTFPLSFRDIQKMMLYQGIEVTYEGIRKWCRKVVKLTMPQQAKLNFKAGKLQQLVNLQKSEQADFTRMDFQLDDAILPRFTFNEDAIRKHAQEIGVKYGISIDVYSES